MKIGCHFGASILDQTDNLPHRGHLIPDLEWFAIDDEVIQPVAARQSGSQAAKS